MPRQIGIMQGRLSPAVGEAIQAFPGLTWKDEFALAKEAGLHHIEWIYDGDDLLNPLSNFSDVTELSLLSELTGMRIDSLCADYFMGEPLLQGPEAEQRARADKLEWLLARCADAKISRLILPFVDRAKLETEDGQERLIGLMRSLCPVLQRHCIELHLETSLAPRPFASLLYRIGSPLVKINYDSGNSAALGYDAGEEFEAYGQWVGSIHIKDRVKGGPTVPLGEGDVDFPGLIRLLEKVDYHGDFVLQVARDEPGDELSWAKHNATFLRRLLSKASRWTSR